MSSLKSVCINSQLLFNGNSYPLIFVERGSFLLDDRIETQVSSFYIGQYLLTQALWYEITKKNPSRFQEASLPVDNISWFDCVEFCNLLSRSVELEPVYIIEKKQNELGSLSRFDRDNWKVSRRKEANGYRLPTEAEWEYAARGGIYQRNFTYIGSRELDWVGWHQGNCDREPQLIGLKAPNSLGIYDMSGNVSEWCEDWFDDYHSGPLIDPSGPELGHVRVLRGGAWDAHMNWCQIVSRSDSSPGHRSSIYGLRLCRNAD